MHALPPAPTPAPRRQLFVGTSLACAAGLLLYGTMIAMFVRFRKTTLAVPDSVWKPAKSVVPEVATNIMLISFLAIYVFVQWAVYAARRDHKSYVGLSIGLTVVVAIAVINAQAFTWFQMNLGVRDGSHRHVPRADDHRRGVLARHGVPLPRRAHQGPRDRHGTRHLLVLRRCGICRTLVRGLRHQVIG
jgi:hypothetical protein